MPRALARSAAHAAFTVAVAATVGATLVALAPGDTVLGDPDLALAADPRLPHAAPITPGSRVAAWLVGLLRGDLGWSPTHDRPVADVLADALPPTLTLAAAALALALPAGVALGTWRALRPQDRVAAALHTLGDALHAVPTAVLAPTLLLFGAVVAGAVPALGAGDPLLAADAPFATRVADALRHLALPAATLALPWTAAVARHQRAALADARWTESRVALDARGLAGWRLARHAVRAAAAPVLALAGLALPALVGGAAVVETIFARPGLGRVAVRAVASRDHALVAGATLVAALTVAAGGALAGALRGSVDPRTPDADA